MLVLEILYIADSIRMMSRYTNGRNRVIDFKVPQFTVREDYYKTTETEIPENSLIDEMGFKDSQQQSE